MLHLFKMSFGFNKFKNDHGKNYHQVKNNKKQLPFMAIHAGMAKRVIPSGIPCEKYKTINVKYLQTGSSESADEFLLFWSVAVMPCKPSTVFSSCKMVVMIVFVPSFFQKTPVVVPNTYLIVQRHQTHKKQEPPQSGMALEI